MVKMVVNEERMGITWPHDCNSLFNILYTLRRLDTSPAA